MNRPAEEGVSEGALGSPVLQTRLQLPPLRARLVERGRLSAAIERALEGKLLLLSAPAGYGKTTLLNAWAHESGWPVAWYALESADNDRTRFLTYLIHALRRIEEGVGRVTLEQLASRQARSTEVLLTPLVNELMAVPRMALVLDDYHVITEPSIHEALLFLLEHLPASLHLIIATRVDPPLPLARWRARHQLQEIRSSDMRFSREESAVFLRTCMDLSLPEEAIVTLDKRNQGWITGLQLAAIALQGRLPLVMGMQSPLACNEGMGAGFGIGPHADESAGSHDQSGTSGGERVARWGEIDGGPPQERLWGTGMQDAGGMGGEAQRSSYDPLAHRRGTGMLGPGGGALEGAHGEDHRSSSSTAINPQEGQRFVFDYLAEEVMEQIAAPLQEFLLKTSVLNHLEAALCEAVTGRQDCQQQLELLTRSNLFLTPLDTECRWYRYHPIFAEFLRKRLSQSTPELPPELLTRASSWCEQHSYMEEAIEYALAAEQYSRAAQLIARYGRMLLTRRELAILLRWIEKLPAKIVKAEPQVGILYCWVLLFSLQSERIAPLLRQIQQTLDERTESADQGQHDQLTEQMRGEIAAIEATQASLKGDLAQTIARSQQALTWLAAEDLWTRGTLLFFQGVAYYVTGDMTKARQAYQEAITMNRSAGNHALSLLVHCYLARLYVSTGRLQDALHEAARAEQQGRQGSIESAILAIELGNIYYERNEMERAYSAWSSSVEIGKAMVSAGVLRAGYSGLARWQQAQGNVEEVRKLWSQIDQIKQPASVLWAETEIRAYRLQWENVQRNLPAVERGLAEQGAGVKDGTTAISVLTEITYLARARLLIAGADYSAAVSLLERLLQRAEEEQRTGSIISIGVLQAKALAALDELDSALKAIEHALVLAAPEQYLRIFVDEGEAIKTVLQQAAARGIQTAYVMQLLRAFPPSPATGPQHEQPLLDPLSERELEILRCIVRGQSNQNIADTLLVSLNTVKTHISHIFAKLHVNSRTQAVARAKELRII